MSIETNKKEFKAKQLWSQEFVTDDGNKRYNLYAIGEDGAIYRKIGNRGDGWVRLNMSIDFKEE